MSCDLILNAFHKIPYQSVIIPWCFSCDCEEESTPS